MGKNKKIDLDSGSKLASSKQESGDANDLNSTESSISPIVADAIDSLSEDKKTVLLESLIEQSIFRGPLPPPDIMRGYEEILPGAAERILKMAESQQAHRISMETEIYGGKLKQSKDGQRWGGCLSALFGIISFILGIQGMMCLLEQSQQQQLYH